MTGPLYFCLEVVFVKLCCVCSDRALCDVLDNAEIRFWPPQDQLDEISRRLGRKVAPEEAARVKACLLRERWLP